MGLFEQRLLVFCWCRDLLTGLTDESAGKESSCSTGDTETQVCSPGQEVPWRDEMATIPVVLPINPMDREDTSKCCKSQTPLSTAQPWNVIALRLL